ncbi:MAG: RNase H-like domain-containing protein [Cyanobacteria bacterium J06555_13]
MPLTLKKLDASNAYWQICMDEESSRLLTFNTPFGRYRFKRLPYGIHSASELCQAQISQILEGLPGTLNSQDDIIIWAESKEELIDRTISVLQSVRQAGLKLNRDKCVFEVQETTFLGHKLSKNGIEADPRKIEAIVNMPPPKDKKDLQRFLGMVTNLGKFITNLSDLTAPLRSLLEKDAIWSYTPQHDKAVKLLKNVVTSSPVLKFYNPDLPTRLSADASSYGLGALLEQQHQLEWHPVAYASRSLTSAERNYCQLEKETLSIVFGCEKFKEYLHGRDFEVHNDHQPLKSIFTKPLNKSPPRIQRFLLRLQQ